MNTFFYEACRAVYILSSCEKFMNVLFEGGAIRAMMILIKNQKHEILLIEGISGLHKYIMKDEYLENIINTIDPITLGVLLSTTAEHVDDISLREKLAQILLRIANNLTGKEKLNEKQAINIISECLSKETVTGIKDILQEATNKLK